MYEYHLIILNRVSPDRYNTLVVSIKEYISYILLSLFEDAPVIFPHRNPIPSIVLLATDLITGAVLS